MAGWVRIGVVGVIGFGLMACETTEKKKRPPLPGTGDIDSKAWGRDFPGDAQPGLGGFMPQSR